MLRMEKNLDPLVVASNVYRFLDENERVRVLEVVFKPGETAKMHHHPEHVAYVLKGGKIRMTAAGKTDEIEMKAGSVVFLKEGDHEVTNIGNTDVDLLVVELKK